VTTHDPVSNIQLSRLECVWLLRRMRHDRDELYETLLALEERIKSGHNGELVSAHHAIDADLMICDAVIRELWKTCGTGEHPK